MNVLAFMMPRILTGPGYNVKNSKRSVALRKMPVPAVTLAWTVDQIEIHI